MGYIYNVQKQPADPKDFLLKTDLTPYEGIKLPKIVDLRKNCAPVFDQGNLGSCTANAGAAFMWMLFYSLIEAGVLHQDAVDFMKSDTFSRLFLYYKERELEDKIGEDSGAYMRDIGKALQKFGVCLEKDMPYIESNFTIPPSEQAIINALKFKITAYRSIADLQGVKECMALKQKPVLMGMNVYQGFEKVGKDGIVPMPNAGEEPKGGHAVLAVAYNDATWSSGLVKSIRSCLTGKPSITGYVVCQNSWGVNWGDKGFFRLPYEYFTNRHAWDFWTLEK